MIVSAFQTVRDQLVFTNKRIIAIDVQGVTGKRKSFTTLPYSKVQFFTIQTPGFMELFSDTELLLMFSNGFTAKFEFRGRHRADQPRDLAVRAGLSGAAFF